MPYKSDKCEPVVWWFPWTEGQSMSEYRLLDCGSSQYFAWAILHRECLNGRKVEGELALLGACVLYLEEAFPERVVENNEIKLLGEACAKVWDRHVRRMHHGSVGAA